jgi:tetratricopeptide (TPR) repeat protein
MVPVATSRNSFGLEPDDSRPGDIPPADTNRNRLGPCYLLHELGEGGMGRVYLAEMASDRPYARKEQRVAVKVLHSFLAGSEEFVRRFEREATVGVTLESPYVVRTYEAGTETVKGVRTMYIVIEYVEGVSLRRLMQDLGTLPEALLRDLSAEVAQGLAAVHEAGAIHRDIKPENVLITPDHHVKIMDLGIVHLGSADTRLTRTGMAVGTFNYAAPEQLGGEGVGPAADLYALGVLMYEAATGIQPFAAETAAATMWRQYQLVPKRLGDVDGRLSPFIDEIVATLLQKDPSNRSFTAASLDETLRNGESSSWWLERESAVRGRWTGRALRGAAIARDMTFVGRREELATLRGIVSGMAAESSGKVILLDGDTGIGKSRLLDEFVRECESLPLKPTVLYGSCSPDGTGYSGIANAVVDYFGAGAIDSRLAGFVTGPPALVAAFSTLLTGIGIEAAERMSDETVQGLFVELARNLSERRPVVWIVDDVHSASAESQRVIGQLARRAAESRILLVLCGRDFSNRDFYGEVRMLPFAEEMRLAPLAASDVVSLVSQKVSRPSLAEDLGGILAERLDGNPLFVLETLRELDETGTLSEFLRDPASGRRRIDSSAAPSVRSIVSSRLRHVSESERSLLDVAAIIGYEFDPDLISRAIGEPRLAVLQTLSSLERRTGIVRSSRAAFRFELRELRETVYQAMAPLLRAEYHAAIAHAYRLRTGIDKPEETAGLAAVFLATHYLEGKRGDEGLPYVLRALRHLTAAYGADRQALALADIALQAVDQQDARLRCDIQLLRTEFLNRLGRTAEQREAAEDAMAIAARLGDVSLQARAGLGLARCLITSGVYSTAEQILRDSLVWAQESGDRSTETEIVGTIGRICLLSGRLSDARSWFEQQVALARELSDRRLECRALSTLSNLLLSQNEHHQALEYLEREMSIAQEIGYRESEITASFGLGMVRLWRGDHELAEKHLEHQLLLTKDLAQGGALAHFGLVQYWYECGQLDHADKHLHLALDRSEAANLPHFVAYLNLYDGEIKRARGDSSGAREAYLKALEGSRELGAQMTVAECALALGRLLFETGDVESARSYLTESRQLVYQLGLSSPGPLPSAYLALMGDLDPASIPYEPMGRCSSWAELHLLLYQLDCGDFHLARAGELLRRMSAHLNDSDREFFWANNPSARKLSRLEVETSVTRARKSSVDY